MLLLFNRGHPTSDMSRTANELHFAVVFFALFFNDCALSLSLSLSLSFLSVPCTFTVALAESFGLEGLEGGRVTLPRSSGGRLRRSQITKYQNMSVMRLFMQCPKGLREILILVVVTSFHSNDDAMM